MRKKFKDELSFRDEVKSTQLKLKEKLQTSLGTERNSDRSKKKIQSCKNDTAVTY